MQRAQLVMDWRDVLEMLERLLDIHLQHLGNTLLAIHHLKRFAIEPVALAYRARNPNVCEKIHLEPIRAVAFARFTAAALHVETEPPRFVPAAFRLRQLRVKVANVVEDFDIRTGI